MDMKKFDDAFWEVLSWVYSDIGHKAFFALGKTIVYTEPDRSHSTNSVPKGEAKSAIYFLQDIDAIQILGEEDFGPRSGAPIKWELKVLQPKFKEFADELFNSGNPNYILGNTILTWDVINLNTITGKSSVNNKTCSFDIKKTPFKIFKIMLEKSMYQENNNEVSYKELIETTGLKNKEAVKSKIREIRRGFKINRNIDPLQDIFQVADNGCRLVQPESFK